MLVIAPSQVFLSVSYFLSHCFLHACICYCWISGKEWNETDSATCSGQTRPISGSTYPGGSPPAKTVVNQVLAKMSSPVTLLDITLLSQLRKDGHPSLYGFGGKMGNDCSHWCLSGVPDTWNELLYATLVTTDQRSQQGSRQFVTLFYKHYCYHVIYHITQWCVDIIHNNLCMHQGRLNLRVR